MVLKKLRFANFFVLVLIIVLSLLFSFYFPLFEVSTNFTNLITFEGLLFGIVIGFFITHLYSRYQAIKENASIDVGCINAHWIFSGILKENPKNKKWFQHQKKWIKDYVHKFMPLPWEEYAKTEPAFLKLKDSLSRVDLSNENEKAAYSQMLYNITVHSPARQKLIISGKGKLSNSAWFTILILAISLILLLFYTRDGSLVSLMFCSAITSSIILLLLLVKDLNNLNFGESVISVEPYERLLDMIGESRYYKDKSNLKKFLIGK